jgi:hypothetical protein
MLIFFFLHRHFKLENSEGLKINSIIIYDYIIMKFENVLEPVKNSELIVKIKLAKFNFSCFQPASLSGK